MVKLGIRFFLFLFVLPVYPILAQDDSELAMVFMLNHTYFNVDIYVDNAQEPIVTGLASFERFVHTADTGKIKVDIHEAGGDNALANSVSFEAQPGTINYVMLYYLEDTPTLTYFDPATIAGEPIDYATQSPWTYVNLLSNTEAVDVYYDDELVIDDLAYGEVAVAFAPFTPFVEEMRDAETGEVIDRYEDLYGEPYYAMLDVREIEDDTYYIDIHDLITTDLVTYLTTASDINEIANGYTTYLELLEIAGLTELVATADDTNFIVPTDAAFDAIPASTLEALRNDPDQLREVLMGHMFVFGQFADTYEGPREIETLAGTTLLHEFNEDTTTDTLNGVEWAYLLLAENNGRITNLVVVEKVILRGAQVASS